MQLQLQLQMQKKADMFVDDYILKMRGFVDEIAAVGKLISDSDLITNILVGFGIDFEVVVVNLTDVSDSLKLQEVQFALQAHEIHFQNQSTHFFPRANNAYHNNTSKSYFNDTNYDSGGRFSGFRGR